MTRKTKSRANGCRVSPLHPHNPTPITSSVKRVIVILALWGWLPIGLVDWFIRVKGVRDA